MQITGLSLAQFTAIVNEISTVCYDGNVIVHQDAHALSDNRFVARLRVKDSRGSGARTSWSGRHTPSTCWHAYRDVMEAMFVAYPNARARTLLATYRGLDGFRETYPATAYVNIGSQFQPAYMPELCEC